MSRRCQVVDKWTKKYKKRRTKRKRAGGGED